MRDRDDPNPVPTSLLYPARVSPQAESSVEVNSPALSICSGQALLALNSYLPWVSQVLESLASRKDPRLSPPRILMLQSFRELGSMAQNVQWRRGKLVTLLPGQRTYEPDVGSFT